MKNGNKSLRCLFKQKLKNGIHNILSDETMKIKRYFLGKLYIAQGNCLDIDILIVNSIID